MHFGEAKYDRDNDNSREDRQAATLTDRAFQFLGVRQTVHSDHHRGGLPAHLQDQRNQSFRELEAPAADLNNFVRAIVKVFPHI